MRTAGHKRWRWFGLWLLALGPAARAAPDVAMTDELIAFNITAVMPNGGATRNVLIRAGTDDGIVVGWRGQCYATRTKGKGSVRFWHLGAAEVLDAAKHTAVVRVKLKDATGANIVKKNDVVDLKVRVPALKRSILWKLVKSNVRFKSFQTKKDFYDYRSLYRAETPELVDAIVKKMAEGIRVAGAKYGELEQLQRVLENGRYAGRRPRDIMVEATAREVHEYLQFMQTFSTSYYNRTRFVEESFADWVVSGAPYSRAELIEKMIAIPDAEARRTLLGRYEKDIGRVLTGLLSRARDQSGEAKFAESRRLLDVALELATHFQDENALRWHAFSNAFLLSDQKKVRESLAAYENVAAAFARANDKESQAMSLHNVGVQCEAIHAYERARRCYEEAALLYGATPTLNRALTYRTLANLLREQGDHLAAIAAYESAEADAAAVGDYAQLTKARTGRAQSLEKLGRNDEAAAVYQALLDQHRRTFERAAEAEALESIGSQLWSLGRYKDAYQYYESSLKIREELGEPGPVATAHVNIGRLKDNLGMYAEARGHHERSVAIRRALKQPTQVAESLADLAQLAAKLGDSETALAQLKQALLMYEKAESSWGRAYVYTKVAEVRSGRNEHVAARDAYDAVIKIHRARNHKSDLATALRWRANVHSTLRNYADARRDVAEALQIYRETKEVGGTAWCMESLGLVEASQSNHQGAAKHFQTALELARKIGSRRMEANFLQDLGRLAHEQYDFAAAERYFGESIRLAQDPMVVGSSRIQLSYVYTNRGDFDQALAIREQAARDAKKDGASQLEHWAWIEIGRLHSDRGEYEKTEAAFRRAHATMPPFSWARAEFARVRAELAHQLGREEEAIKYAQAALKEFEGQRNDWGQAASLHAWGSALQGRGDSAEGLKFLRRAIPIAERAGQALLHMAVLGRTATLLDDIGKYDEARALAEKAAGLVRDLDVPFDHGQVLILLGRICRNQKQFERARAAFDEAMSTFKGTKPYIALVTLELGRLEHEVGDYPAALRAFGRSIANARSPHVTWKAHFRRSRTREATNDLAGAAEDRRAAVAILDEIRSAAGNDPKTQKQFLRGRIEVYESMAELLGRLIEAEKDPAKKKDLLKEAMDFVARAQFEVLKDGVRGGRTGNAVVDKLLDDIQEAERENARLQKQIDEAEKKGNRKLADELTLVLATNRKRLDEMHAALHLADPKDFGSRVKFQPKYVSRRVKHLPENARLVMYFLGEKSLFIWVFGKKGIITWTRHDVGRKTINERVAEFRRLTDEVIDKSASEGKGRGFGMAAEKSEKNPEWYRKNCAETREVLRWLYDKLMGPVAGDVVGADPLLIMPYGSLNLLPFDALIDPNGKFLVDTTRTAYFVHHEHLTEYLPALRDEPTRGADLWVGFVDPVGKLNSSLEEAWSIQPFFKRHELNTEESGTATEERLLRGLPKDCSILHFATHGFLNSPQPSEPYLELAASGEDDGRLMRGELDALESTACVADGKLRLVVLSACNTARTGGTTEAEMLGMPDQFLFVGSPAVVASLWPVYTTSTTRLMVQFYKHHIEGKKAVGTALRQARLDIAGPAGDRVSARYAHPYYWSAFLLYGDWR